MPNPDPLAALVQLSNRIGQDPRLVQPGGGNTLVELDDTLLVKGSGTDLRTIGPEGFTRLSLARLARLAEAESMSDDELMHFMARLHARRGPRRASRPRCMRCCHRVIVHPRRRHDESHQRLTPPPSGWWASCSRAPWSTSLQPPRLPRPRGGAMAARIPEGAIGLTLAHHGLVVWGDDADEAERRLGQVVAKIDEFIAASRRAAPARRGPESRTGRGGAPPPGGDRTAGGARVRWACLGSSSTSTTPDILATLAAEVSGWRAGNGDPEHLRAGRLPVRLDLDLAAAPEALVERVRSQVAAARAEYEEYHGRHAGPEQRPLDDWPSPGRRRWTGSSSWTRPTSSSSSTGRWSVGRSRRRSPGSGPARSCPGTWWW
jgi:rhamnose utilization protein RhaD (predicted bifunctional aldolase and dehydrogenase)